MKVKLRTTQELNTIREHIVDVIMEMKFINKIYSQVFNRIRRGYRGLKIFRCEGYFDNIGFHIVISAGCNVLAELMAPHILFHQQIVHI